MGVAEVKPGQIWRSDENHDDWLVTRTYHELLDLYVVLRKTDGPEEESRRLKAQKDAEGYRLPGFTMIEG
ncbi:MAG TPA: hypothetical protein VKV79_04155 [Terriglobia bacterium]|nr:hypothetical protein [Terriglobia bacterium]